MVGLMLIACLLRKLATVLDSFLHLSKLLGCIRVTQNVVELLEVFLENIFDAGKLIAIR